MKNTVNLSERLEFLLGKVRTQRLFSGIGVFYENHMFAICKKGHFYLRAKGMLVNKLDEIGAVRWDKDGIPSNLRIRDYYHISDEYIMDNSNDQVLIDMIRESIKQVEDEKNWELFQSSEIIRRLPNLSLKYERLLAKVGIKTISQLRTIGAANSYVLLKSNGFFVTNLLFWKVFAALKNKYVELLTEAEKEEGFIEVNKKLSEAGFRKMKNKYPLN